MTSHACSRPSSLTLRYITSTNSTSDPTRRLLLQTRTTCTWCLKCQFGDPLTVCGLRVSATQWEVPITYHSPTTAPSQSSIMHKTEILNRLRLPRQTRPKNSILARISNTERPVWSHTIFGAKKRVPLCLDPFYPLLAYTRKQWNNLVKKKANATQQP